MKTSVKLLIGLFLGLIIAMFVAAASLRHQYDAIDKNDPYARWKKQPLPHFEVVQVTGLNAEIVVQIEPGPTPRLLSDTIANWYISRHGHWSRQDKHLTVRVERDTLFLQLQPVEGSYFGGLDDDFGWARATVIVQLPHLEGVRASGVNCQIRALSSDSLQLWQGGKGGRLMLDKMRVNQLTATVTQKNQLVFYKATNDIKRATIAVRDSARLAQYGSFKEGLTLTVDLGTNVRLMGKDLQRAQQASR